MSEICESNRPPHNTTVAFIGIGLMGYPMAANLAKAGYQLQAWNRSINKAAPLTQLGAQVCDSVEQALQGADLVVTMLETGPVVDAVLYQRQQYKRAPRGTLFIDMSCP